MMRNAGKRPIVDIRCILEFPNSVRVMNRVSLERFWDAYPKDEFSALLDSWERKAALTDITYELLQGVNFHIFESGLASRIERPKYALKKDLMGDFSGRTVEFRTPKLQRESVQLLEPLYLRFSDESAMEALSLEYRCESDRAVVTGTLQVVVFQEEASPPDFQR